ncbi:MAG: hypothetical protein MUF03_09650 [Rubrivivax sp.]|jgi:hypothetical protein|nr:hypothetical protein [Rubrivivax sp.]
MKPPTPDELAAEPEDLSRIELRAPGTDALVRHPDGWYWLGAGGRQQFGPFETAADAEAAMLAAADDEVIEPGETLQEAEQELGIAEWIDPETGAPAEDVHARLEDH